jgi:hypothetical protein
LSLEPFQPSLTFVGKSLPGTSTLAYYEKS